MVIMIVVWTAARACSPAPSPCSSATSPGPCSCFLRAGFATPVMYRRRSLSSLVARRGQPHRRRDHGLPRRACSAGSGPTGTSLAVQLVIGTVLWWRRWRTLRRVERASPMSSDDTRPQTRGARRPAPAGQGHQPRKFAKSFDRAGRKPWSLANPGPPSATGTGPAASTGSTSTSPPASIRLIGTSGAGSRRC